MRIRDKDLDGGLDEPVLNLTPMIDVVFLLLIFFMVATTFLDPERQIDIDLPQAESGERVERTPEEVVINVFRDGRIRLGDREVDTVQLEEALVHAARRDPETPVTIRGDRLVHHQDVVMVMDACSKAGLSNLAVGTMEGS